MKNQNITRSMNNRNRPSTPGALKQLLTKSSLAVAVLSLVSVAQVKAATLSLPSKSLSSYCVTASFAGGSGTVYYTDPFANTPSVQSQNPFIQITSVKPTGNSYTTGPWTWAISFNVTTNYACQRNGTILIDGLTFTVVQSGTLALIGLGPPNGTLESAPQPIWLTWTPACSSSTNTIYRVLIYNDSDPSTPVMDLYTHSTSQGVGLCGHPGSYRWYVQAGDSVGCSPSSSTFYWGLMSGPQHFTVFCQ